MHPHINPLSKRQRGIYSETVEKDNARNISPTQQIDQLGSTQLFKFIPKNKPAKALSLASLSQIQKQQKLQQLQQNAEKSQQKQQQQSAQQSKSRHASQASLPNPRKILHQRLQTRNEKRNLQFKNANQNITSVDPKIMEPYDAVPGQVPRNVAIDRRRKEFASYGLDELLEYVGVDFNKKDEQVEWLQLELFDDTSFDDNSNNLWISRKQDPHQKPEETHILTALGLYQNSEGRYRYRKCIINNYNFETEQFEGHWKSNERPIALHRLFLCFDAEDPRKYVLRIANAFQQRIYSDSIIRYNFYIDNMPIDDLSSLDQEQKKRIENLAKSSPQLEQVANEKLGNLITEVDQDYNRTMNKIIFDEYLESNKSNDMYPHHLQLPPKPKEKETPYLGAMELERNKGVKEMYMYNHKEIFYNEAKDFTETFKDFCFASLYIKEEVIKALQEIRIECNKVRDMQVFDMNLQEAMFLDQFKSIQEHATSLVTYHLKGQWVDGMVKIIKTQFQDVGKGWFNMKETSKITYDFGKLKRFLTLVRLMMQDTLTHIVNVNYHAYEKYILSFVPDKVEITSSNQVKNIFHSHEELIKQGKTVKAQQPLFQIDLWKQTDDSAFIYTTKNPNVFVQVVLNSFDKALEQMAKVPDLEPKILSDLYKSKSVDTPIKCPMKPREKPIEPNPNELPRKYPDENKWIWDMYENIKENFQRAILPLQDYLVAFDPFLQILQLNSEEYCRKLEMRDEEPADIDEISGLIQDVKRQKESLKEKIPETIVVSCFEIHNKLLLIDLEEKLEELSNKLKNLIAKRCRESTSQIFNSFSQIRQKIQEEPEDIEKLTDIKEYMNNMPMEIEKLKVDMDKCFDIYQVLEDFNYKFSTEEMNKRWQIFGSPKEIYALIEERDKQLERLKKAQQTKMLEDQEQFKEEVTTLELTIKDFAFNFTDINAHEEIARTVQDVNTSLQKYQEQSKLYNSREALFETEEMSDYSKIPNMQRDFAPYSHLWNAVHGWKVGFESWMYDEWANVDALECQKFCDNSSKSLAGVVRFLKEKGITTVLPIAEQVKKEIDEYRPKIPLLVALRNRGMTDRHWKAISEKCGKPIKYQDAEFSFDKIIKLGLMDHLDFCLEQGEKAGKEITIENKLDEMEGKWEDIHFEFKYQEKQQMNIIKGFDDITQILDEDIVSTQAMLFSPFKKPFEERIIKWDATLKNISDILEEWAKLQANWLYLQPIFDSKDIAKQLPNESKKFSTINSMWGSTMTSATTIKRVLQVCNDDGLCERLKDANITLDLIQKELNKYLESKKEKFARFYFLSNDELLEILSQTKEPTAVQPHLKKVFENIHRIRFDDNKKIHAMFSGENEEVKFVKFVDPVKKNVEDWMGELETMMKKSVRQAMLNSIQNYMEIDRKDWVLQHPGQCVLNGSQVHWTSEVEAAMNQTVEGYGIKQYFEKLQVQLNDLVELVVQPLTKQQQVTINALIVIDVHAKDVTENLMKQNINSVNAFEWISQLRYEVIDTGRQEDLYTKMVTTVFPYGYEYLGNTLRLVITPLTDKCYMTLMSALKLNYGGAPAGPAGTGKTESTKDLAKALAKQCVVFNCSDQMDYIMVGQFFKGLASAGAWCCFDEFNRINIEVLSVIAQMLRELYDEKAKSEGLDGGQRPPIQFQDSIIKVNPTFSVFITMNPGYAGRTELPDNLKALFRGVAMMVPDYAMIGEIMLYSFGFKTGRSLARKMVVTFKLASEQLSSQSHYDYGMRAVRSVINAAGLLKQDPNNADMQEDQLLLRALRDVNVPKFLRDDIPLFENIITDLFPTTERPKYEYGNLEPEIEIQCKNLNVQPVPVFTDKIKQLYDTIQVRHGLMLVGPTGGGKTKNYQVLQKSMSSLKKHKDEFFEVHTHILNPKSITMGQLYGEFTLSTHEWVDGIVANMIRETVKDQSERKHWVVFDGPVDAIWIESMNTVLDDNKKLCLNSGQILTLTPHMTMMFEVEDLEVASPATVSRCGMVYMEPISLGLQPLISSWIDRIPENIKKINNLEKKLQKYFDKLMKPLLDYLHKNCKEIIPSMSNNLLQSCTRIMDCFFEPFMETDYKKVSQEEIDTLKSMLESLFIFSFTWSFLCTVDNEGREKLNLWFKEQTQNMAGKMPQIEGNSIYDFYYNVKTQEWQEWRELYKNFEIMGKIPYNEIVVPTNDSTRNIFLKKLLLTQQYHVMCPGTTGTGKSQNCYQLLSQDIGDEFQYIALTFSAQTSANQTQDTIDSKLEKRRKGIYGPPIGKKCVVFVDDLNMPKKEEYGAQPPIELLRQFLDHQGWYNRKELTFMTIQDVILLSAMGPPGGGRSAITNRATRHFNVICYPELDREIIKQIFNQMVGFFYRRTNDEVKDLVPQLVSNCLDVYYKVKQELLPTPSKSHYTFNMRDVYRVCQGLCSSEVKLVNDIVVLNKLWYHENMRVYHDRLTTEEDRIAFKSFLYPHFETIGSQSKESVLDIERVIFTDFLQGKDAGHKVYSPVQDLGQYVNLLDSFQDDYNNDPSFSGGQKKQMKLVMFLDACEHIARIARIIRQPYGNALLFGVGGSGRQSLSKIATFLNNYKLFQIEVVKNYRIKPQWKDDCKKVLMMAGVDNKPVTFLFVDTQIIDEQMLEDINNILNSGDVTGIYQEKDFEDIQASCKADCIQAGMQPTKMNLFTVYLKRVKKNIHIILAMSPIGEAFQTRIRMFPSLINCCTIDWFTEWPEEALQGVGKGQLIDYEEELKIQGQLDNLVTMFKQSHKFVEKQSVKYLIELRRHNYVTPTSYLELLSLFKMILSEKNKENEQKIQRLQNGLQKLMEANKAVGEMEIVLTNKQPLLKKAQEDTEVMVKHLEKESAEAAETQKTVNAEEKIATKAASEAEALAKKCMDAVDEANKNLEETLVEVKKIKKTHLDEVKALQNPPKVIVVVLTSVVIVMGDWIKSKGGIIKKKVEGAIGGQKVEDYLETAKKYLLNDTTMLLKNLLEFDRENINPEYIKKLEKVILNNPEMMQDFNKKRASEANVAVGYLYGWSKAMYDFFKVFTETQPLRDQLQSVQAEVKQKLSELKEKQDNLAAVNAKIAKLQADYAEQQEAMRKLDEDINNCKTSLERARRLTFSLGDEKERWTEEVANLKQQGDLIPGNSALSAIMLAYAGAFESKFRAQLEQNCIKTLQNLNIKHTPEITMKSFLGDEVKIQQWTGVMGLPKDNTSVESGIIMECSKRWPLMIDPQNQANKYIKNRGREEGDIDIMKISDPRLMRNMETAILLGHWVLLENVGTELDPSLEPILLQQIVQTGNTKTIQIGDKTLQYSDNFKLFLTTTLPNPHYSPETSVKVTIINFAITPGGLEEQMLAKIVELEAQQLEDRKNAIVSNNAKDQKLLVQIENNILNSLSGSKGGIEELLADESLIQQLDSSKKTSTEIKKRVLDQKVTGEQIDREREGFRPVAYRAAILFFAILELALVDPMYQYSLQWYIRLFEQGQKNAPQVKDKELPEQERLAQRLENLNEYFTYSLYENVCRSLFEKDKLLFSFLLTQRILDGKNQMNKQEWKYLLSGPSGEIKVPDNPTEWIDNTTWIEIYKNIYGAAQTLEAFQGFDTYFLNSIQSFKEYYDSSAPQDLQIPDESWENKLTQFEKLIILKCIRPDKVIPGVQNWVAAEIGQEFIETKPLDLAKCFEDSSIFTPLIFVLSTGSDPVADFDKFAEAQNMKLRNQKCSLGQGQGPKAAKMIQQASQNGGWVLLQNCHLAVSWMPELEKLVEEIDETNHKDFRLWLTSMPAKSFPVSVLQNGIKMTMEPPKGLRANLMRNYYSFTDEELNDCKKPEDFKKLLFGFCLFHAIIQDRRKFGPIGWNISYEFTTEDLVVCKRQLKQLLDDYEQIPFKVLQFMGSVINYGGRVTDDKDGRLIQQIIKVYVDQKVLMDKYKFSESGLYYQPAAGTKEDYINYIQSLPLNPSPEAFGMNDNAEITNSQNETRMILETLQSIEPRSQGGEGKSREAIIEEIAINIENQTPPAWDVNMVSTKYPTDYNESMNTVLLQEIIRYNRLLSLMAISLVQVKKALKGMIVMSEELESVANAMFDNNVPNSWQAVGHKSLKPLASWIIDLKQRVQFLQDWIDKGTPKVFWISGFYFPQAFITGTLQNYARTYGIAIDLLQFDFNFKDTLSHEQVTEKPKDGVYIYGIYIEGAKWDFSKHRIGEPKPKELYSDLPLLHIVPKKNREVPEDGVYNCPMYKTVDRRGTLSTTGHSTNFVMYFELPSKQKEDYWIRAGVATFLSLRY